MDSPVTVSLG